MRYISTIFWVFLLTSMAGYVTASMSGVTYSMDIFKVTTIVSFIVSILLFVLGELLITDEGSNAAH